MTHTAKLTAESQVRRPHRHLRWPLLGSLMLIWNLLPSHIALAAETVTTCDQDPICDSLLDRARKYSSAGQLEEALRMYQAAYVIVLDPVLLFNMARAQQKLGRPADAAETYRRFLATGYDRDNLRERAEAGLSQTTSQLPPPVVAVVEPVAPPVTSVVAVAPGPPPGPFYKRPWFWGVIGSVVAGAVTSGVAAGVVLSQQPPGAPSGTAALHPFMP